MPLASLSEPATLRGLHLAELAVLVFGLAFLCGWIAEELNFGGWKKAFIVIALIGVTGEWIADLGVFELTEHLQSLDGTKIATLNLRARALEKEAGKANAEIAASNEHAANAEHDTALAKLQLERLRSDNVKFERVFSGRVIVRDKAFDKLKAFAGVHAYIQEAAFNDDFNAVRELSDFARDFLVLQNVGWKVDGVKQPITSGPGYGGVRICSGDANQMMATLDKDPYSVRPDSPAMRGWLAGEALARFLKESLDLEMLQHTPSYGVKGALMCTEFAGLPADAVLIEVGYNSPQEELQMRRLEEGWNQ